MKQDLVIRLHKFVIRRHPETVEQLSLRKRCGVRLSLQLLGTIERNELLQQLRRLNLEQHATLIATFRAKTAEANRSEDQPPAEFQIRVIDID